MQCTVRGMRSLFFVAAAVLASCAHPNQLTVAENRNEASIHAARAGQERAQFDPGEARTDTRGGALGRAEGLNPEFSYNPTQEHQMAADTELRLAASHLAAAKKLETFEDAACKEIAPAERAACPLLGSLVVKVQHTATGFQLAMKPGADVADIYRRLNCHLSYARATGFERPSCPLFLKGTTIRREGEGVIEFAGETKEIATELQLQARRVLGGAKQSKPVSAR